MKHLIILGPPLIREFKANAFSHFYPFCWLGGSGYFDSHAINLSVYPKEGLGWHFSRNQAQGIKMFLLLKIFALPSRSLTSNTLPPPRLANKRTQAQLNPLPQMKLFELTTTSFPGASRFSK